MGSGDPGHLALEADEARSRWVLYCRIPGCSYPAQDTCKLGLWIISNPIRPRHSSYICKQRLYGPHDITLLAWSRRSCCDYWFSVSELMVQAG
jgi:hypothetical protein